MATIYWAGGTDTDIDDFNNYVTSANGTSVISDNSGDFTGDDVIFQSLALSNVSANPTVNANETFNSIRQDAGSTLTGNASYSITVDGEADGTGTTVSGYAVDLHGALGTNVNLIITTPASTLIDLASASSGTVHNLTYNASSRECTGVGATTIAGNLTITAGTFAMYNDVALTVTGQCFVTGTLTGNASAISVGNMKLADGSTLTSAGTLSVVGPHDAGWLWYNAETDGTAFAPSAGTVHFNHGSNLNGKHIQESKFYNLSITGGDSGDDLTWRDATGNLLTIGGDLAVTNAQFQRNTISDTLTVTGDVTLATTAILGGNSAASGANNFGSLTIADGTTYNATSGTTTITSKTSDSYGIKGGGTFTHNNGEVKVTGNAFRFPIGATYYDFTWDTSSEPCYLYSTTLGGGATIDGTQNAGYTAILGTLKINDRGFLPYSATKVFINNLIIGDTTDSANATTFDMQDSDVFDGDVIVNNILINADGQLKFGDNHAGKSDALEVRGAFRSLGGASGVVVV